MRKRSEALPATEENSNKRRRPGETAVVLKGGESRGKAVISKWRDNKLCDVLVVVDGVESWAHRVVLACGSDYMAARFERFADADSRLEIPELQYDTYEPAVEWLYTGSCWVSEDKLMDLLTTAVHLQIATLQAACVDAVIERLSADNVCGAFEVAERLSLPALTAGAMKLATLCFKEVAEHDHFTLVPAAVLTTLLSRDSLMIKEESVACDAVVRWIQLQAAPPSPETVFGLLRRLRLNWLSFPRLQRLREEKIVVDHPQGLALVLQGYEAKAGRYYWCPRDCGIAKLRSKDGSILPRAGFGPEEARLRDPRRAPVNALSLSIDAFDAGGKASLVVQLAGQWPTHECLAAVRDVNAKMIAILVDWLFEVAVQYQQMLDTVHVAINYLLRYLQDTPSVTRERLQGYGLAALMCALDFEEVSTADSSPREHHGFGCKDAEVISACTYTAEELTAMRRAMTRRPSFTHAHLPVLSSRVALSMLHQRIRVNITDGPAELCALCTHAGARTPWPASA